MCLIIVVQRCFSFLECPPAMASIVRPELWIKGPEMCIALVINKLRHKDSPFSGWPRVPERGHSRDPVLNNQACPLLRRCATRCLRVISTTGLLPVRTDIPDQHAAPLLASYSDRHATATVILGSSKQSPKGEECQRQCSITAY